MEVGDGVAGAADEEGGESALMVVALWNGRKNREGGGYDSKV